MPFGLDGGEGGNGLSMGAAAQAEQAVGQH